MYMEKNFTQIYLYSNFEDDNIVTDDLFDYSLDEYNDVANYLNKLKIKAPNRIVNNIFRFAEMYS